MADINELTDIIINYCNCQIDEKKLNILRNALIRVYH